MGYLDSASSLARVIAPLVAGAKVTPGCSSAKSIISSDVHLICMVPFCMLYALVVSLSIMYACLYFLCSASSTLDQNKRNSSPWYGILHYFFDLKHRIQLTSTYTHYDTNEKHVFLLCSDLINTNYIDNMILTLLWCAVIPGALAQKGGPVAPFFLCTVLCCISFVALLLFVPKQSEEKAKKT